MVGEYIGVFVTAFVIIPVVLFYLNNLLRPVLEIKSYVDDVLQHGVALTATLDDIPKLVATRELSAAALEQVGRYGAALVRVLNAVSASK